MRGAPGIQYLFSPFDRLIFTLTPAQMRERFKSDVSHPLFVVGVHNEGENVQSLIVNRTDDVISLLKSGHKAFVDSTTVDLNQIKNACIRQGLIKQTKDHLVIYGLGRPLELPSRDERVQKPFIGIKI